MCFRRPCRRGNKSSSSYGHFRNKPACLSPQCKHGYTSGTRQASDSGGLARFLCSLHRAITLHEGDNTKITNKIKSLRIFSLIIMEKTVVRTTLLEDRALESRFPASGASAPGEWRGRFVRARGRVWPRVYGSRTTWRQLWLFSPRQRPEVFRGRA